MGEWVQAGDAAAHALLEAMLRAASEGRLVPAPLDAAAKPLETAHQLELLVEGAHQATPGPGWLTTTSSLPLAQRRTFSSRRGHTARRHASARSRR
jgi:hypothetical protein